MEKERLKQICGFLNDRLIIHRNVENDTPWTTEEKMIKDLYDDYLDLLIQLKKQKEIITKIEEKIKKNIKNAKYEITTLTITDRVYYKYIDDMLNDLLQILEDKEV